MYRVIVAGSRSVCDEHLIFSKHDKLLSNKMDQDDIQIVSGTARGVDQAGERYAASRGLDCVRFPADWEKYGRRAGYLRNCQMAENADALVAFWDGQSRGTKHMIEIAKARGLAVRIVTCISKERLE